MVTAFDVRTRVALAFSPDGVTLDAARVVLEYASERAQNDAAHAYVSTWSHALEGAARHGAGGTVKAWARSHDGAQVDVLQVQPSGASWCPGPRQIDSSARTTGAYFQTGPDDVSLRNYAGTRVLVSTPDVLIFAANGALILWRVS